MFAQLGRVMSGLLRIKVGTASQQTGSSIEKKTERRKAGIACQLGQPWIIAHLGDLCVFYLLFLLLIGILPTERRVQQSMQTSGQPYARRF